MRKTVCDGRGIETEICVFRRKGFECKKVGLRIPYNMCCHWKTIEVSKKVKK